MPETGGVLGVMAKCLVSEELGGSFEIRRREIVRYRLIKRTGAPLALVVSSKGNVMSDNSKMT